MQGFVLCVFLFNQMLIVAFCENVVEENVSNAPNEKKDIYLENRRKLPLFPKNSMKFLVTPKPYSNQVYTHQRKEHIMTKMPLISFVTPKVKSTVSMTQTSRKPLMKLRTFTVQSRENGKYKDIEKLTKPDHVSKETNNSRSIKDPVTKYLAEHITEVYKPEESKTKVNKLLPASPIIKQDDHKQSVIIKTKADEMTSEEEQDRNEFIFLEKEAKLFFKDLLDDDYQDVRGVETTTEVNVNKDFRVRRSHNIIEEENMGTTISGMKYTGRDTRLVNNDMYFKNIHS